MVASPSGVVRGAGKDARELVTRHYRSSSPSPSSDRRRGACLRASRARDVAGIGPLPLEQEDRAGPLAGPLIKRTAPRTAPARNSCSYRTCCLAQPCGVGFTPRPGMPPAGFEPGSQTPGRTDEPNAPLHHSPQSNSGATPSCPPTWSRRELQRVLSLLARIRRHVDARLSGTRTRAPQASIQGDAPQSLCSSA